MTDLKGSWYDIVSYAPMSLYLKNNHKENSTSFPLSKLLNINLCSLRNNLSRALLLFNLLFLFFL